MFNHLLLYCRAGFEGECAAEIQAQAATLGIFGYARAKSGQGYVLFVTQNDADALELIQQLRFSQLIFARQWVACMPQLPELPQGDRVGAIAEALEGWPRCGELWVETADTNEAKSLLGFCRKFTHPLRQGLRKQGVLSKKEDPKLYRLHLFMLDSATAFAGLSLPSNSAQWYMGIPRLKFPAGAPSRSTLKLEEAWHQFVPAEEWDERLRPGMRAVDLGAAPGGWTYQLVKQSMFVTAVDNGPMNPELMETGQVDHQRVDGFIYEPPKTVDWLVCDIVDKPARVADMIFRWAESGWFREAVFNLKLPMKKRYQEVAQVLEHLEERLKAAGCRWQMACKQLYHDREEVTVHLRLGA